MKKNLVTTTLNVTATVEGLKALNAFMDTMGIQYEAISDLRTEEPKAESAPKKTKGGAKSKDEPKVDTKADTKAETKGKAAKTPKVYKVDKYGNQWIIKDEDFNMADYRAKGMEMYGYERLTSRKYRENVYRALGYIL